MSKSLTATAVAGCMLLAAAWLSSAEAARGLDKASIERGRYIAKVAGCNDCHTPNYAMSGGNVPEKDWLTGDHLGWKGPWGTTYPANLRIARKSRTSGSRAMGPECGSAGMGPAFCRSGLSPAGTGRLSRAPARG